MNNLNNGDIFFSKIKGDDVDINLSSTYHPYITLCNENSYFLQGTSKLKVKKRALFKKINLQPSISNGLIVETCFY